MQWVTGGHVVVVVVVVVAVVIGKQVAVSKHYVYSRLLHMNSKGIRVFGTLCEQ